MGLSKSYKKSIKDRDKFKCQNPRCHNKDKRIYLIVYHIRKNKDDISPWNLITLCTHCYVRIKNERTLKVLLTYILNEKYSNNWNSKPWKSEGSE